MFIKTLDNGLELCIKENHFAKVVALQAWINVGSMDEDPEELGLAHFLEHMVFKGSAKYGVGEIPKMVESWGGDINAYTTFDHTVVYLTIDSTQVDKGLDLIREAVFCAKLDESEFEKERKVILEEISRGQDNPSVKLGRELFKRCFDQSEASRPIIGSVESVEALTYQQLVDFYNKWYQPNNVKLVVVGDVDAQAVYEKTKDLVNMPSLAKPQQVRAKAVFPAQPSTTLINETTQQLRLEIALPAPTIDSIEVPALDLLAFALSSGELGRLNGRLRDELGIVTAVHASVYATQFGGMFTVSCFTEQEHLERVIGEIFSELGEITASRPITDAELDRALVNLETERHFREETVDGQARNLGWGLRTPDGPFFEESYIAKMRAASKDFIVRTGQNCFDPQRAQFFLLAPNECSLTSEDFDKIVADQLRSFGARKSAAASVKKSAQKSEAIVEQVAPWLRVIIRRNEGSSLFSSTMASEGGLRYERAEVAGFMNVASSMLGYGDEDKQQDEFLDFIEGRGAVFEGFSGKDSIGIHAQGLCRDFEAILPHIFGHLKTPVFPEAKWQNVLREINHSIKTQNDSPSNVVMRAMQKNIYGEHPYARPLYGTAETVEAFDKETVRQMFTEHAASGPWTMSLVGDFNEAVVLRQIEAAARSCDFAPERKAANFLMLKRQGRFQSHIDMDKEQVHLVVGFPGFGWSDNRRYAMDVLMNVLGGQGGRLFVELRDKKSLAYSVSPLVSYGCDGGLLGAYIACAESKVDEAYSGICEQLSIIKEKLITEEELENAKSNIIGSHAISQQRSDAQASTMALMEAYGYGYDDFLKYPKNIAAVNREQLLLVAKECFDFDQSSVLSAGRKSPKIESN